MYKVKKEVMGLGLRKECPLGREDFREAMTALQEAFDQKCALHKLLGGIGDLSLAYLKAMLSITLKPQLLQTIALNISG